MGSGDRNTPPRAWPRHRCTCGPVSKLCGWPRPVEPSGSSHPSVLSAVAVAPETQPRAECSPNGSMPRGQVLLLGCRSHSKAPGLPPSGTRPEGPKWPPPLSNMGSWEQTHPHGPSLPSTWERGAPHCDRDQRPRGCRRLGEEGRCEQGLARGAGFSTGARPPGALKNGTGPTALTCVWGEGVWPGSGSEAPHGGTRTWRFSGQEVQPQTHIPHPLRDTRSPVVTPSGFTQGSSNPRQVFKTRPGQKTPSAPSPPSPALCLVQGPCHQET